MVFGIIGLFTNPFLILIAVFIWFGAAGESQVTQTQAKLAGVPVERAMLTSFETLSPINSLRYVSQLVLAGSQQDFPVVENGRPIGLVTRADLFNALTQYGSLGFVSQAMRRDFATVEATDGNFKRPKSIINNNSIASYPTPFPRAVFSAMMILRSVVRQAGNIRSNPASPI